MERTAKRVTFPQLKAYVTQPVRVVGKIESFESGILTLSDNAGQKALIHSPVLNVSSDYVEIVGTVNPDFSITSSQLYQFGSNFDLSTYEQFVVLSQKYPQIF